MTLGLKRHGCNKQTIGIFASGNVRAYIFHSRAIETIFGYFLLEERVEFHVANSVTHKLNEGREFSAGEKRLLIRHCCLQELLKDFDKLDRGDKEAEWGERKAEEVMPGAKVRVRKSGRGGAGESLKDCQTQIWSRAGQVAAINGTSTGKVTCAPPPPTFTIRP
ncbi:hypothetical protein J6590_026440 [Homalodisca vitripennis]|nr:hypothetical protein J6590_096872 [Homalodisca vitripennis]KAG8327106.1 hypothetical protein J6590_026440 [Homalodisca vitripennis]